MKNQRILSMFLVVAMLLSLLPAVSFANEGTVSWKKIDLADIRAEDTVAITMTKDSTTYALPTVGEGGSKQPLAIPAAVEGDTLTTRGSSADFGWKILAKEGGYYISFGDKYLYVTATNNGVRIGNPKDMASALWNVAEGYLTAPDSKAVVRYLGVYQGDSTDWRCYNGVSNNIAGEILNFWVLDGETPEPDPDPTPNPEPDPDPTPTPDPEPDPDPTPTPDPEPDPDPSGTMCVIAANVGGTYYAMANTFDAKVESAEISVTEGTVEGSAAGACAVELTQVAGGWTISYGGKYLAYKTGTNLGASA
ncbi:MAG: hypothetical protein II272_06680, partial [Oscillospiraceae bacterium]|nr:hypothetical protein [Oscillospiraceae bacterium]